MPTEVIEIIDALKQIAKSDTQKQLLAEIQPDKFFKSVIINKNDVKQYEKFLVEKLHAWSKSSVFSDDELTQFFNIINGECEEAFEKMEQIYGVEFSTEKWSTSHIYDLVASLHKKQMLPAIVFCKTVTTCNLLATALTEHLQALESQNRVVDKKDEKATKKIEKELKRAKKSLEKSKSKIDAQDEAIINAELESCIQSTCDANKIDEAYSFLDFKHKATNAEIEEEIHLHRRRNIPKVNTCHFFS